jgi:hypothetical protein
MAHWLQKTAIWIIGILFLGGVALYNGYPLVTSDTGTYINSAFTQEVARDRPFGYSILIAATSLKFTLWLPVLLQCTLLLYLVNQLVAHVIEDTKKRNLAGLGIVIFISLFTSAGWYSSMLMPDIFTAAGGLAFLLFILEKDKKKLVFYGLVLLYVITTHTSHLLIFSSIAILTFLLDRKQRKDQLAKYITVVAIALSGWLIVPALHWAVDGKFMTSESTHVFLTGRFLETGTLHRYLDNECTSDPIQLCAYRYDLPVNAIGFIWSPESPLYKTNGWEDPDHEYLSLIHI